MNMPPKDDSRPEVLRFTAPLFEQKGRMLLEIPDELSQKLHRMLKAEGMMNGQPFRALIDHVSNGSCFLRVNAAMLRGAHANVGDVVEVALLGPEPEPLPPSDLQAEFDMSPEAVETWNELTELGKRDWIRWVEDAKKPETRARRIARTIEQLSHGKRRACCVDVNGFMMCRIEEDNEARKKQSNEA